MTKKRLQDAILFGVTAAVLIVAYRVTTPHAIIHGEDVCAVKPIVHTTDTEIEITVLGEWGMESVTFTKFKDTNPAVLKRITLDNGQTKRIITEGGADMFEWHYWQSHFLWIRTLPNECFTSSPR